ncbi:MAG: Zn-dependent hydrolase [Cyanobacteria bacterium J083]|nr:MAG: Zn-dependent hydrolase [Cyanobacteria bacterium J083]
MKRRQLLRYTSTSLLTLLTTTLLAGKQKTVSAQANALTIKWLGHSCFLFTGGGMRVLVNPFRPIGCTAGYRPPQVQAEIVAISSYLFDEGAAENLPGNPRVLFNPGDYKYKNTIFKGISIAHDRLGGKRFGNNIAWRWQQAGLSILHLGGAAAPIAIEQKILMGSPDIVLVPVGGGDKNYNAAEAIEAIKALNPKLVIPTQYLTAAADQSNCNIAPVDEFIQLAQGMQVKKIASDTITVRRQDLPQAGTLVKVLSYRF